VWYPLRAAAGIPESVVFHDLRHSQASLMLAAGVSLKTIQARLGHQDFGTTANTYSHLLAGAQAEAVAKVDELMSRVKKRG
jgi:integrase